MEALDRRVRLALSARPASDVWDALAEIDPSLSDAYWERMHPPMVPPMDVARASRELLAHDRPWTAIDLLAGSLHRPADEPTSLTADVVRESLTAALSANPDRAKAGSLGYELGVLLDYLEREGAPAQELARYEFVFFPLLTITEHRGHCSMPLLLNQVSSLISLVACIVARASQRESSTSRRPLSPIMHGG